MNMKFELNEKQARKAEKWRDKQNDIIRKLQGLKKNEPLYYGAIGGEVTFSFTQTFFGMIVKC